jgi:5-methylcytosine-specific restriction endonuclease McrA
MKNAVRRIKIFRPRRGAVRLTMLAAFNYDTAYGQAWDNFKKRYPIARKLCELCGKRAAKERHHLVPVIKGGQHTRSNVSLTCDKCHARAHPHLLRRKAQKNGTKFKNRTR